MRQVSLILLASVSLLLCSGSQPPAFTAAETALIAEHVYGGLPGSGNVRVRTRYVISYAAARRVPKWVAYHVTPAYLDTPTRNSAGRWKRFRNDPDIDGEARDDDYTGLQAETGYVREHLAPYFVMGGDRDGDGLFAAANQNAGTAEDDHDDALTVHHQRPLVSRRVRSLLTAARRSGV